jgi:hypothetical protein
MTQILVCAAFAPVLLIAACDRPQSAADQGASSAPLVPGLTPEAERGETGARNVLLGFARAIELKDYGQAWTLLSPADQQKWSRPAFAALFADLDDVTVAIPSGTVASAADAQTYAAPVTITGSDRDGRPIRYEGEALLRQATPGGAGAAPGPWRFVTLTLDWTH